MNTEATRSLRIALAEDHHLMRDGIKRTIEATPGHRVVLEAKNGVDLRKQMEKGPMVQVAIIDLHMPIMDGWKTIRWLTRKHPGIPAIAISFYDDLGTVAKAMDCGARSFIHKGARPEELAETLRNVVEKGHHLTELVQQAMMTPLPEPVSFTENQMEYLQLTCEEPDEKQAVIADRLRKGKSTVDGYRHAIYRKFNVKTRTGMVIEAIKRGLFNLGEGPSRRKGG